MDAIIKQFHGYEKIVIQTNDTIIIHSNYNETRKRLHKLAEKNHLYHKSFVDTRFNTTDAISKFRCCRWIKYRNAVHWYHCEECSMHHLLCPHCKRLLYAFAETRGDSDSEYTKVKKYKFNNMIIITSNDLYSTWFKHKHHDKLRALIDQK